MRSLINGVLVLVGIAASAMYLGYGIFPPKVESSFTHEEVLKINPIMVIDRFTLLNPERVQENLHLAINQLISRGLMVDTPIGLLFNNEGVEIELSVIIQSGGGQVDLGRILAGGLHILRQAGFSIHCYVGEAQSMAFYIMVTSCDKVTAKVGSTIMQHRSFYGRKAYTPSTYLTDLEMARGEARSLRVDFDEWLKLTRGEEDHVFTLEEITKYKLVHKWVK